MSRKTSRAVPKSNREFSTAGSRRTTPTIQAKQDETRDPNVQLEHATRFGHRIDDIQIASAPSPNAAPVQLARKGKEEDDAYSMRTGLRPSLWTGAGAAAPSAMGVTSPYTSTQGASSVPGPSSGAAARPAAEATPAAETVSEPDTELMSAGDIDDMSFADTASEPDTESMSAGDIDDLFDEEDLGD
jgi:hypothetical protein